MRLGRVLVLILLASVLQAASPRDQLRQGAYARFGYTDVKTRTAIYVLLLRAGSELPADLPDRPRREDPYFSRIEDAGGFKKYEQAHLATLTATFSPKLSLPARPARLVVEFYLHAGFYPFTPAA